VKALSSSPEPQKKEGEGAIGICNLKMSKYWAPILLEEKDTDFLRKSVLTHMPDVGAIPFFTSKADQ
jgi:hypothetical protein